MDYIVDYLIETNMLIPIIIVTLVFMMLTLDLKAIFKSIKSTIVTLVTISIFLFIVALVSMCYLIYRVFCGILFLVSWIFLPVSYTHLTLPTTPYV